MLAQERYAVFNLAVALVALAVFGAMIPKVGVMHAQGMLGLLGFSGFSALFLRRRSGQVYDERDRSIMTRANLLTFAILWGVFVVAATIGTLWLPDSARIPARILPLVVFLGLSLLLICQSAFLLILYRRT